MGIGGGGREGGGRAGEGDGNRGRERAEGGGAGSPIALVHLMHLFTHVHVFAIYLAHFM